MAEIFAMPFMVTYVVERSNPENRGSYMGMYSFAYAVGHVLSPILSTMVIEFYGYEWLWWLSAILSVFIGIGFYYNVKS